jgi:hypothetical protein
VTLLSFLLFLQFVNSHAYGTRTVVDASGETIVLPTTTANSYTAALRPSIKQL